MDGNQGTYAAVNEAISEDDLVRLARRGHQIEKEVRETEVGRMIYESSQRERQAALEDLAECDPVDTKAVTQAQFRYHVASAILTFVHTAIQAGQQAQQDYELAEAPD